ncbi:GGDEF domain-containing protein [Actinoplanes sichuanensis]|uniref:GGDEF domain-containing protein n=1 Tax=Actinoplanes sichuanensis TaxID=512349 RepID=A0ABW4A4U1_9ACTN|nr:GGDEF domain-containing protein [Actinoplanes sichuanensis]
MRSAWRWYVVILVAAVLGYFRTPDTWLQTVVYDSIAVSGVIAMVIGVRRNRAEAAHLWIMFAGCKLLAACGDFVYAWYARHLGLSLYPAPADGFYLVAGACEVAVLVSILRRRLPARDPGGLIEAVIITGSVSLIAWVYLLKPATQDDELTAVGRIVAISYPILDLLLFMLLTRMLVGGGMRNGAFRLLACGMMSYLAADYAWAFTDHFQFDAGTFGSHLLDSGYLLAFVLYGAAGLHPGIRDLAAPVQVTERGFSRWRLALLTGATMIAPVLLAAQAWFDDNRVPDAQAIAGGCVGMFLLVVARMTVLIRQVERQASKLESQAEELTELAQRDTLTGLANRRAWEQALPLALDHARRDGTLLTLAVLDLDHFKRFNDQYGHQAGDRLLKEAAAAWASGLRAGDLLARYGGEEFALIIPCGGSRLAAELLDRLRPLTPSGQTFSAGVAVWDGQESSEALFARADAALYEAKGAGRDRVALAA